MYIFSLVAYDFKGNEAIGSIFCCCLSCMPAMVSLVAYDFKGNEAIMDISSSCKPTISFC